MKVKRFKCYCGEYFTKRGLVEHHKTCEVFKKTLLEKRKQFGSLGGKSSHNGRRKTGYINVNSKEGGWTCECGQNFRTRRLLNEHKKECSIRSNLKRSHTHLNQYTKAKLLGLPKPEVSEETRKKLSLASSRRRASDETKAKISESMKKAHAEGRAHNVGECRWNNEPSYPEQWFMRVLKNEFGLEKDKDYKMEYPFHKFSLDFAWPEEKLCIEIDGDQHLKFQEQKDRDIKKDQLLKEEGWKELRMFWKDIFNDPKSFIEEVKNLLGRC